MGELTAGVALVTGGGTGIGAAIAVAFARAGAAVAITGRRPEPLHEVVGRIEAGGGAALACPCDVTDFAAMERAATQAVERFGGLDVVVANASAAPRVGPTMDDTVEAAEAPSWI